MASETHDAAGQAASTPGLPQLDFSTFGNQIFWLLVTLVVIYFVLSRIALPRIAAVLAERKGAITNDLAAAEDLKAKAVEAEQAYLKALADARAGHRPSWVRPRPRSRPSWTPPPPRRMPRLPLAQRKAKKRLPTSGPVPWTASRKWPSRPQPRSLPSWVARPT